MHSNLLGKYFFEIIQFIPKQIKNKSTAVELLNELGDFVKKHQKILAKFICDVSSHYFEYTNILKDIEEFIDACNGTTLLEDVRDIIKNRTFINKLAQLINFDNIVLNTIVRKIVLDQDLMNFVLDFFKKKNLVRRFADIL